MQSLFNRSTLFSNIFILIVIRSVATSYNCVDHSVENFRTHLSKYIPRYSLMAIIVAFHKFYLCARMLTLSLRCYKKEKCPRCTKQYRFYEYPQGMNKRLGTLFNYLDIIHVNNLNNDILLWTTFILYIFSEELQNI